MKNEIYCKKVPEAQIPDGTKCCRVTGLFFAVSSASAPVRGPSTTSSTSWIIMKRINCHLSLIFDSIIKETLKYYTVVIILRNMCTSGRMQKLLLREAVCIWNREKKGSYKGSAVSILLILHCTFRSGSQRLLRFLWPFWMYSIYAF